MTSNYNSYSVNLPQFLLIPTLFVLPNKFRISKTFICGFIYNMLNQTVSDKQTNRKADIEYDT